MCANGAYDGAVAFLVSTRAETARLHALIGFFEIVPRFRACFDKAAIHPRCRREPFFLRNFPFCVLVAFVRYKHNRRRFCIFHADYLILDPLYSVIRIPLRYAVYDQEAVAFAVLGR